MIHILLYKIRKYAHPLYVKEGIITEKVFPVFSESFFWTCFGLVMYIWELMGGKSMCISEGHGGAGGLAGLRASVCALHT